MQVIVAAASSIGSLCMLRARHRDSIGVWFVAQVQVIVAVGLKGEKLPAIPSNASVRQ
jgi:hypothetical protein